MDLNIEGQQQNTEIKANDFTINKNVIKIGNIVFNLRNISYINSGNLTVEYPWKVILLLVLAAVVFFKFVPVVSVVTIIVAGWLVYHSYNKRQNPQHYLSLHTNSGHTYSVSIKDKEFREKVVSVIENNINGLGASYMVNIDNKKITNESHGGVFNYMENNTGTVSISAGNVGTQIDYEKVLHDILEAKKDYRENSEKYQALTDFEKVVKTKDNTKIAKFLKNSKVITLNFIKAVLSEVVVNQISTNFFNI